MKSKDNVIRYNQQTKMTLSKQSRSFATYVQKVLKQVHPDGGMTQQAMDAIDSVLRYFARRFAEDARRLALDNDTKTISSREIETAVNMMFTPVLAKNAMSEGNRAVSKYSEFESSRNSDKTSDSPEFKVPKTMKQVKAGLVFSVSLVDNDYLRNQGVNVGQGAPVYLSAVLEYLACELLEISGNVSRNDNRARIKVRDVFLAVQNDKEFSMLFREHNLVLIGTGVVANIDQRIIDSYETKSAKKPKRTNGAKTTHRYRPGTVALREIRQQQKSTRLLLCKVHIQKACKEIMATMTDDSKVMMSQEARNTLHYIVEQNIVNMFQEANKWCLHAGRNTVYVEDIQMAFSNDNVVEGSGDAFLFTQPPITALARRAGVYRMGGDVWKEMKDYVHTLLHRYLHSAVLVLRHQNRQSINLKVLSEALSTRHNLNLCIIPRKIRRSKKSDETGSQVDTNVDDDGVEDIDEELNDLVNEDDMEENLDDEALEDIEEEVKPQETQPKVETSGKTKKNTKRGKKAVVATK